MYFEGLNSSFCNFIEEKIRYTYNVPINQLYDNPLFIIISHNHFYEVYPLFNYDQCISSNNKDHTTGKVLILEKKDDTVLSFESSEDTISYTESSTVQVIDNIQYTLYYTFNNVTGEPVPYKMTSSGGVTDKHGYFLDSEVIIWVGT